MAVAEERTPTSAVYPHPNRSAEKMRSSESPYRQRPLGRASTSVETSHPLRHRRSSTFSDSLDDARNSIKSSTDDLLLPRAVNTSLTGQLEHSHWHSTPLALALLPALGGVLFQNGNAIVTDITLLGLAAVFLNWSVRLPWEWYHAAQSPRPIESMAQGRPQWSENTIVEEDEEELEGNGQVKGAGAAGENSQAVANEDSPAISRSRVLAELRIHESLALFACFVSPLMGGWLLHTIRHQLSRPSESLISNYNLTVFLLASEIRPVSHLIKMIQARTLYLQRTAGSDMNDESISGSTSTAELTKRLDELESFVAQPTPPGKVPDGQAIDIDKIKGEVRGSMQPDLDALNRAVRRYEKRMVALTMQTESRLQELESRLSDAITLAAAAERSSTQQRGWRGSSTVVLVDWMAAAILLPLRAAWTIIRFPAQLLTLLLGSVEAYVGNKVRREMKTAGRSSSGQGRKSNPGSAKVKKAM
ncbi:MAG: hypothetical protein Q9174_003106 [Haloplaca sp. 1 TL-2023]